jgi:hypothetical protein
MQSPRHPLRCQHNPGEFAEFCADLRFGKSPLEIAAIAVAGPRRLMAVGQGHADSRRPQPRRHGAHRWIFGDMHAVTQCRDLGIVQSGVVELGEAGISPDDHRRGGVRSEYFEAK